MRSQFIAGFLSGTIFHVALECSILHGRTVHYEPGEVYRMGLQNESAKRMKE
jgi:hypothetical protein